MKTQSCLYEFPPKPISGRKSCPELTDEPDYKKYGWLYENDKHDIRANGTGVVVSNREWGYNLVDFQSLVKVGVDFKAQCTGCISYLEFKFFMGKQSAIVIY